MKEFTVLLGLPDYLAEDWCETYQAWVSAVSPLCAAQTAQQEAGNLFDSDPLDFAVIAVYSGHLKDLKYEATI